MTTKDQIQNLSSEFSELKKSYDDKFKSLLDQFYLGVFQDYPLLKSFGWRQYTPYFNDGDTCEFFTCLDDLIINGLDDYDFDEEETGLTKQEFDNIANFISSTLSCIDDEIYLNLYGDHSRIIINRSDTGYTVDVQEYDHD